MKFLKNRIRSGIRTGFYLGVTTLMATALLSTAAENGVAATSEATPAPKQLPRKIYGHYMGCYPVGDIGRDDMDRKGFRHDSSHLETASGGRWKGFPLVPRSVKLTMDEKADLEIRRAIRSGLDGFAIDAWAGGDGAKAFLDALFRVAEAKNYPFEITICLDHSCLKPLGGGQEPYLAAIRYVLDNHGSSKNLARRDGKPLFFAYASRGILGPQFIEDESKWPLFGAAYKELQEKVGQPLYFQVDIGNFFARAKTKGDLAEAAGFVAKDIGAVGFFLDGDFVPDMKRIAKAVRDAGGEWSPPIWFQYDNAAGLFFPPVGTSILRRTWEGARDEGATLLQFVTWNDYTEYTSLAPTTSTGYGIGDLNRYLAEWWKKGTPPEIDRDRIYVSFHKYAPGANIFPFNTYRSVPDGLEVATILTRPGVVKLPGRTENGKPVSYNAPKGLFVKVIPLSPGPVKVELLRKGKVKIRMQAQEWITDKPFRQDNSLQCLSTEDLRFWNEDFPGVPYPRQCEYGDDDHDGLPNWFEMYWFGKWGDYSTTTYADSSADPDGDGKTNLQEHNEQTDPTQKPYQYTAGMTWGIMDQYARRYTFRRDRDIGNYPVWGYLYKSGTSLPLVHDGNYSEISNVNFFAMRRGSPYKIDGVPVQYGELQWFPAPNDPSADASKPVRFRITPRGSIVSVAWESPVDGIVKIHWKIAPLGEPNRSRFTVERSGPFSELSQTDLSSGEGSEKELNGVAVRKGDRIYFVADSVPTSRNPFGYIDIESITITLESLSQK